MVDVKRERHLGRDDWDLVYPGSAGGLEGRHTLSVEPMACPEQVRLRLITPVRIRHQGRPVEPGELTVSILLRHLVDRTATLIRLYGSGCVPLDTDALRHCPRWPIRLVPRIR